MAPKYLTKLRFSLRSSYSFVVNRKLWLWRRFRFSLASEYIGCGSVDDARCERSRSSRLHGKAGWRGTRAILPILLKCPLMKIIKSIKYLNRHSQNLTRTNLYIIFTFFSVHQRRRKSAWCSQDIVLSSIVSSKINWP